MSAVASDDPIDDNSDHVRIAIVDGGHRKSKEYRCGAVEAVRQIRLAGHAEPCLVLETTDLAGDSVPFDLRILSRDGDRIESVLSMDGLNAKVDRIESTPSGHPTVSGTYMLAHFADLYNRGPDCGYCIRWTGGDYTEVRGAASTPAVRLAAKYREAIIRDESQSHMSKDEKSDRHVSVLGYIANSTIAGDQKSALRWLRSHDVEGYRWIMANMADLKDMTTGQVRAAENDTALLAKMRMRQ